MSTVGRRAEMDKVQYLQSVQINSITQRTPYGEIGGRSATDGNFKVQICLTNKRI